MRMNKTIGTIAIIAAIGLVFIACSDGGGGTTAPALLKINPKDLPRYEGKTASAVKSSNPASQYYYNSELDKLSWIIWNINDALERPNDFNTRDESFLAQYSMKEGHYEYPNSPLNSGWLNSQKDNTDWSYSIDKDISAKYLEALKAAYPTYSGAPILNISWSHTWKSNLTYAAFRHKQEQWDGTARVEFEDKDTYSASGKWNDERIVPGITIDLYGWDEDTQTSFFIGKYKVSIKALAQGSDKDSWTMLDKLLGKVKQSYVYKEKWAYGISITHLDHTNDAGAVEPIGAKFIYSIAKLRESSKRKVESTFDPYEPGVIQKTMEAYDNDNKLIYVFE